IPSLDQCLRMLARFGQPLAGGLTLGADGRPVNGNPVDGGTVLVTHARSVCQATVPQSLNATHHQIDGGLMDGFAQTAPQSMVFWNRGDIPFYYSLARHFTLANRWFGSAPCQTYPNRRFLLAGTAYGLISTDVNSV